jgi:hypothetical protein
MSSGTKIGPGECARSGSMSSKRSRTADLRRRSDPLAESLAEPLAEPLAALVDFGDLVDFTDFVDFGDFVDFTDFVDFADLVDFGDFVDHHRDVVFAVPLFADLVVFGDFVDFGVFVDHHRDVVFGDVVPGWSGVSQLTPVNSTGHTQL